jgi:hypothetical protein
MSHLGKRLTGVEALIGLQALDVYLNLPFVSWPDWALVSVILGRRVTPAEMQSLERHDAFERMMEEIVRANKEGKMEAAVALLRAKFSAPSSPR